MTDADLRTKIRELMASGALPRALPLPERVVPGQALRVTQIVIGTQPHERCLVCKALSPHVSYTYPGGKIVRLHAACNAIWRQERETP